MRPAGEKVDLDEAQTVFGIEHAVGQLRGLRAVLPFAGYADGIALFVLGDVARQYPLFLFRDADGDAEIQLFYVPDSDRLVEDAKSRGVLSREHETACVAVYAVSQSRNERILGGGIVLALFV